MERAIKIRIISKFDSFHQFFDKDYFQGGERNGPVVTAETIGRHLLLDTSLSASLENYLSTIPIGPITFFDAYDKILPESVAYHKSIERKKIEALENKMNINKEKFEVIKGTILNKLSNAPWAEFLTGSKYFRKVTEHLLNAPSKATKKTLQVIVDDIRPKLDALFAFLKLDFLFDSTLNSTNQSNSSSASANVQVNSYAHEMIDLVRRERRNIAVDHSFEISLKEHFNQRYANNQIYTCITDRAFYMISKFYFHEAIIDLVNVKAMFLEEIENQYGEHAVPSARKVYQYLQSKKYTSYHRDDSDVVNDTNKKFMFDFHKSVYCEAKLYYPVVYHNITEYISLSWLRDEDKEEIYEDNIEEEDDDDDDVLEERKRLWNNKLNDQLHTIWLNLEYETIDHFILKKYLQLYENDWEYL
jgi:hypothetical protein